MADEKLITFASMPEGHGGTFPFDPIHYPLRIGTYSFINSVGIYLPLPGNRSFAAHIYAGVKEKPDPKQKPDLQQKFDPKQKPDPKTFNLNFDQYRTIRDAVHQHLAAHAKANDWTVQDVLSTGKRPCAMCPVHSDAARAIINGIKGFLGLGGNLNLYINDGTVQGFYAEVQTGVVQNIEQKWKVTYEGERFRVKGSERAKVGFGADEKTLNPVGALGTRKD